MLLMEADKEWDKKIIDIGLGDMDGAIGCRQARKVAHQVARGPKGRCMATWLLG